jgi:hypothetical protein
MDSEKYPDVSALYPIRQDTIHKDMEDYMDVMEKKFHYEGGQRVYHIKEVTVVGSAKTKTKNEESIYAGLGKPVGVDEIAKTHIWHSALDIVASFPGVFISENGRGGGGIQIFGCMGSPLLVEDDVPLPPDISIVAELKTMYVDAVGSVNVLKGPETALFGIRGANGVILVNHKTGNDFRPNDESTPSLAIIKPLGYYQPAAFYSPKYLTPEQINDQTPDLRTTIYWNPSISLSQNKPTQLSFHTADRPGLYTITLEGLTSSGEPLHVTSKLLVKQ